MMCTIGFGAYCAGAGDEPGSRTRKDNVTPSPGVAGPPEQLTDPKQPARKAVGIERRGNQLVITSDDKETLDLLGRLARDLTAQRPDENLFKVIRLKNVSAEDAARTITELFNGPQQNQPQPGGGGPLVPPGGFKAGAPPVPTTARVRVVAEKSSNSIVVIKASPIDLLTIEQLLKDYVDRESTKGSVPPEEKAQQPKTFELRIQYIKHSDGKKTEIGFYLDSYHPEFDGRGGSRGRSTADDVEILIDGKKGRITDLLPGDTVTVQLSPDRKSVTRIELSLKSRLNVLEKEADALRQRIQSLEKGK
jgi:hypothetical protein